jgi:hypothetical protein
MRKQQQTTDASSQVRKSVTYESNVSEGVQITVILIKNYLVV